MSKGSDWLKCDLHVHTPMSFFNEYGNREQEQTWQRFIQDLESLPREFRVLGINDYLTIEGYEKLLKYKDSGRLSNIDCILPVVEFRINRFAGHSKLKRVNYHVVFSNEITPAIIQSQFLNCLANKYTLDNGSSEPDWSASVTDDSLIELGKLIKGKSPGHSGLQTSSDWDVGFNNFTVDYDDLKDILNRPAFKGRIITAIGKSEWDDYRWDSGAADKRTIINEADFVFLSSESPEKHATAKSKLICQNVNSTLIDCSDAHYFSSSEEKDRIGNCWTWLKMEPTFHGLKQVLFDPEDRICVGVTHPNTKSPYQVIAKIQFEKGGDHFTDEPIKLSPGLSSIIGGKSTGKSLLAGLIVKTCDLVEFNKRNSRQNSDLSWIVEKQPDVSFNVTWCDGTEVSLGKNIEHRKITYFPQNYFNSQINDNGSENKELNKIIRNILSQNSEYRDAFQRYDSLIRNIDQRIANDSNDFEIKITELKRLHHTLNEKGKSIDIQTNIDRLNAELIELKNKYDLSVDEIETHQNTSQSVDNLQDEKEKISDIEDFLSSIQGDQIKHVLQPMNLFNSNFEGLDNHYKTRLAGRLYPVIEEFTDRILSVVNVELDELQKQKSDIDLLILDKTEILKPIINKIQQSEPLKQKSELIRKETQKLSNVKKIEDQIEEYTNEINKIQKRLSGYLSEKEAVASVVIDTVTTHPFIDDEELGISIAHMCKSDHIQKVLYSRVKYQSNSSIKTFVNESDFRDADMNKYQQRVDKLLEQVRNQTLELKGDSKAAHIIQELLSNGTYLNYDLMLNEDSFSIMSPGKRALALLRVLIELDQSLHPIILDQPEDDLDNRSVYGGLAKYLKKKKKDRQIIVVTHNPNVVVGADSEYVIVANQRGQEANKDNRNFKFEYTYGGLENTFVEPDNPYTLEQKGIREHVCEILDGGETAFDRREKLYSSMKGRS